MTTLTVSATTNFSSNASLSLVDALEFGNASGTVSATFKSSQFDGVHLLDTLAITGSSGTNSIVVNLDPSGSLTFSAAAWVFSNWSANDAIVINGSAGGDALTGSTQADIIDGGDGNDIL